MVMPFEGRWIPDHEEHVHTYANLQKQLKHRRKTGEDMTCPECREEGRKYMQEYRAKTSQHRKTRADTILRNRHLTEWKAIMHLLAEGEEP